MVLFLSSAAVLYSSSCPLHLTRTVILSPQGRRRGRPTTVISCRVTIRRSEVLAKGKENCDVFRCVASLAVVFSLAGLLRWKSEAAAGLSQTLQCCLLIPTEDCVFDSETVEQTSLESLRPETSVSSTVVLH